MFKRKIKNFIYIYKWLLIKDWYVVLLNKKYSKLTTGQIEGMLWLIYKLIKLKLFKLSNKLINKLIDIGYYKSKNCINNKLKLNLTDKLIEIEGFIQEKNFKKYNFYYFFIWED